MSCLKLIDVFGNDFKLNLGGIEKHKSLFGGIFSLLLIFTIVILTWYFGQDIYLRENPTYISKTVLKTETPMLTLNSSVFSYAYRFEDANGVIIDDPKFFEYEFEFKFSEINNVSGLITTLNLTTIKAEKCNAKHF